jgi:hypothetical protein
MLRIKKTMPQFYSRLAIRSLVLAVLITLVSACVTEVDPLDAGWGNSVQRMLETQTYEPEPTPGRVANQPQEGLDGKLSEKVYTDYKTSTGKSEKVRSSNKLELNID